MNKVIIVIPARKDSKRFPNKPLAYINGKSLIERVWQIGMRTKHQQGVYVATNCEDIRKHCYSFGAEVLMTGDCATGTDRVYQAAKDTAKADDIIISLQGDAVLTPPWIIDDIVDAMQQDTSVQIASPMVKLSEAQYQAFVEHKKSCPSAGTNVVVNKNMDAMYFSKNTIPYHRTTNQILSYRHIGLYAYRMKALQTFTQLSESTLEKIEGLEQLRALENGLPIRMVEVDYRGRTHGSVDYRDDIEVIENIIEKEGELL